MWKESMMSNNRYSYQEARVYFENKYPEYANPIEFDWGTIGINMRLSSSGLMYGRTGGSRLESYSLEFHVSFKKANVHWKTRGDIVRGKLKLSALTDKKLFDKVSKIAKASREAAEIANKSATYAQEQLEIATRLVKEINPELSVSERSHGHFQANLNISTIFTFHLFGGKISGIKWQRTIPYETLIDLVNKADDL